MKKENPRMVSNPPESGQNPPFYNIFSGIFLNVVDSRDGKKAGRREGREGVGGRISFFFIFKNFWPPKNEPV